MLRPRHIAAAVVVVSVISLGGCASVSRFGKSIESDFSGGLDRVVNVYTNTGQLVESYEGKIDIQYEDNRTLFDIDGKRVTINGGITIVEEV